MKNASPDAAKRSGGSSSTNSADSSPINSVEAQPPLPSRSYGYEGLVNAAGGAVTPPAPPSSGAPPPYSTNPATSAAHKNKNIFSRISDHLHINGKPKSPSSDNRKFSNGSDDVDGMDTSAVPGMGPSPILLARSPNMQKRVLPEIPTDSHKPSAASRKLAQSVSHPGAAADVENVYEEARVVPHGKPSVKPKPAQQPPHHYHVYDASKSSRLAPPTADADDDDEQRCHSSPADLERRVLPAPPPPPGHSDYAEPVTSVGGVSSLLSQLRTNPLSSDADPSTTYASADTATYGSLDLINTPAKPHLAKPALVAGGEIYGHLSSGHVLESSGEYAGGAFYANSKK